MADQVETMAYVGETPWHGLGIKVEKRLPVPRFLEKAGLNWEVAKTPLVTEGITLHDHYGLIRRFPDGTVSELGVCGKQYVPTQNQQAFEFFDKFCRLAKLDMETAGSLNSGRHIYALAKIPGGFELPGKDQVDQYLLLSHPHIWGKSFTVKFTPIRVVCMNTLMMALRSGGNAFNMRHIYTFDAILQQHAIEAVESAMLQMTEFQGTAEFLASKGYTDEGLFRYIADQFQEDLVKEEVIRPDMFKRNAHRVLELVSVSPGHGLRAANNTWWGAFNAVTYFFDHEYGHSDEGRLNNAWFGGNAGRKLRALDLAVAYAKAA